MDQPRDVTSLGFRDLESRFPSNPLIIRVPFFLLFNFNKETPKEKGQKGTTGVPRNSWGRPMRIIVLELGGLDSDPLIYGN